MKKLTGTGVALVTPFHENGTVDWEGLKRLTDHVITGGVEYLVILGTTGESATLDENEQEKVIGTILETNAGRVPFVLGAGGNDTAKVCHKIEDWTDRYDPAAFLSVSPYYNKPSQAGIIEHFRMVAGCTDSPIILYNVPGRTASNMLPATVIELAQSCENVLYIKEASGNVEQGMDIVAGKPDDFSVLSGDDTLGISQVAAGFEGVISVAANALPFEFSEMIRAALAGDFAKARKLHYSILKIMQLHFAEGNPAGVKASLHLKGICGPHVRLPLVPASAGLMEAIKKELTVLASS